MPFALWNEARLARSERDRLRHRIDRDAYTPRQNTNELVPIRVHLPAMRGITRHLDDANGEPVHAWSGTAACRVGRYFELAADRDVLPRRID